MKDAHLVISVKTKVCQLESTLVKYVLQATIALLEQNSKTSSLAQLAHGARLLDCSHLICARNVGRVRPVLILKKHVPMMSRGATI